MDQVIVEPTARNDFNTVLMATLGRRGPHSRGNWHLRLDGAVQQRTQETSGIPRGVRGAAQRRASNVAARWRLTLHRGNCHRYFGSLSSHPHAEKPDLRSQSDRPGDIRQRCSSFGGSGIYRLLHPRATSVSRRSDGGIAP